MNEDVENMEKTPIFRNRKFRILAGIILTLFLLLIVYQFYLSPTGQAKRCVDNYLKASKNGESTSKYKDFYVDDFINVLDYKYLKSTASKENATTVITMDEWEDIYNREMGTFEKYKEHLKSIYTDSKVITDTTFRITFLHNNIFYDSVTLLYDMEVTNALGTRIYKKVEFEVDNETGEYLIMDYDY